MSAAQSNATTNDPFAPLKHSYALIGQTTPETQTVLPEQIPPISRKLLHHTHDMTSTLSEFSGEQINLRSMQFRRKGNLYVRQVILRTETTKRSIEFGAIQIHINQFSKQPLKEILQGTMPLGAIIELHGIKHQSKPTKFFSIKSDKVINHAMDIEGSVQLFGRCNTLSDDKENTLAEVVEILPPEKMLASWQ